MDDNTQEHSREENDAQNVKVIIPVCTDHVGIIGQHTLEKAFCTSYLLDLIFI